MSDLVDQERAAPVNCASGHGIEDVAQEGARAQGIKNNRHLAGWNLARPKTPKSAFGGLSADLFGGFHLPTMSGGGHPMIPLHAVFGLSDGHAEQRRGRAFVLAGKADCVCERDP